MCMVGIGIWTGDMGSIEMGKWVIGFPGVNSDS
jgi:hypothetical protein